MTSKILMLPGRGEGQSWNVDQTLACISEKDEGKEKDEKYTSPFTKTFFPCWTWQGSQCTEILYTN